MKAPHRCTGREFTHGKLLSTSSNGTTGIYLNIKMREPMFPECTGAPGVSYYVCTNPRNASYIYVCIQTP